MAEERDRDLSKVLRNVETEMTGVPTLARQSPQHQQNVQDFAPQKYRDASDSLEQVQHDLRKTIGELEARLKAIIEVLKRITG
jgi:hypothetical protein